MDEKPPSAEKEHAGRALYTELLAEYQAAERRAKDAMTYAAIRFSTINKEEERHAFLEARARHGAAEEAILTLTKRGGLFYRLTESQS